MKARVLIVEDHTLMLQGLRSLLKDQDDIEVVDGASNGLEALRKIEELQPNIVILDLMLPGMSGLEIMQEVFKKGLKTKIIIVSAYSNRHFVLEALKAGAVGYLVKQDALERLVEAISAAVNDEPPYLSPQIKKVVVDEFIDTVSPHSENQAHQLSERESQVLRLILQGRTSKEIASELTLSLQSISGYKTQLMKKLGVENIVDLTKLAIREGWLSLE